MLTHAQIEQGDFCLEIGSGSGKASLELAKYFTVVCGVEPSLEMCRIAKLNAGQLRNFHCINGKVSKIERIIIKKLLKKETYMKSKPLILITGLFHVFNYLSPNELSEIGNFAGELMEDGFQVIVAFDHWSSDIVLEHPPEITVKKAIFENRIVTRTIVPEYDSHRKCWNLEVRISQEGPRKILCSERHSIFVHTDSLYKSTFHSLLHFKDVAFPNKIDSSHPHSYGILKVFKSIN